MNDRELAARRQQRQMIDDLHRRGVAPSRIARQVGVEKKVVKKHLRKVKAKA